MIDLIQIILILLTSSLVFAGCKVTLLLHILVSWLVGLPAQAIESSGRVSIEDAKKFAIERNFEVAGLRKQVEEMAWKSRGAKAPFFPKLGIAGGGDLRQAASTNEAVPVGYVFGSYNLFRGFSDTYRAHMASLEADKAEISLRQAEFGVGLDVEQQFYSYLLKKKALDLKTKALGTNESHKKMAKQRRSSGLATDSDVLEFDLRDSLLRSDVVSLEQELDEYRVKLKELLGEEIGSKIEPVGTLKHQHLKGTLMDYIKRLPRESEAILIATKEVAIAQLETKISKSSWLPEIEIETKAGFLPLESRLDSDKTSALLSGMLIAKLNLFSGFEPFSERQAREAKLLRLEASLKNVLLTSISQMEISFRKIKAIESRVHLEAQNEERSQKYYQSVLSEYRRGIKNSADVRAAAETLYEASLRREGYKYEFLNQRIAFDRALGGTAEVENAPEDKAH